MDRLGDPPPRHKHLWLRCTGNTIRCLLRIALLKTQYGTFLQSTLQPFQPTHFHTSLKHNKRSTLFWSGNHRMPTLIVGCLKLQFSIGLQVWIGGGSPVAFPKPHSWLPKQQFPIGLIKFSAASRFSKTVYLGTQEYWCLFCFIFGLGGCAYGPGWTGCSVRFRAYPKPVLLPSHGLLLHRP